MHAREVMTTDVVTVAPETPVEEIAYRLLPPGSARHQSWTREPPCRHRERRRSHVAGDDAIRTRLLEDPDGYTLSLQVSFAQAKEVSLDKVGDELVLSIGNFRRTLFLPRTLVSLRVEGATLETGWLQVVFRRDAGSAGGTPAVRPPRGNRTEARETRG